MKSIKKQHGSVSKFLSNPENVNRFFNNPIIQSYLARNANEITFASEQPAFDYQKDFKDRNDFYEVKVYKKSPFFTDSFRSNVDSSLYYRQDAQRSFKDILIHEFSEMNKTHMKDSIYVTPATDINQIRHIINAISYSHLTTKLSENLPNGFNSNASIKFVLSPNWMNGHATMLVTILDEVNKNTLATIFIDSVQSEDSASYIEKRFNALTNYYYRLSPSESDAIAKKMESLKKDENHILLIDNANRIGYLVNNNDELFRNFDLFEANESIDVLFVVDELSRTNTLRIVRPIPFIDASHNLQITKEDNNCTLYELNFLNASVDLLSDPKNATRIYALAQKINPNNKDASIELQQIFQNELKRYLPRYYDNQLNTRTSNEIKKYHLEQRWDLESKGLANKFGANSTLCKK